MKRAAFDPATLEALRAARYLRIRAGAEHRFIGIWMVVAEGRVFARSWSQKPRSWWRGFLEDPRGAILVDGRELPIRAVQTRSERLKDAVSEAYRAKYTTRANLPYVADMCRKKCRDTTTELIPV